jgi:hypothetical protein
MSITNRTAEKCGVIRDNDGANPCIDPLAFREAVERIWRKVQAERKRRREEWDGDGREM